MLCIKPYSETEAEFTTAAEEGKAPDVLRSYVGLINQFAAEGYLLNIDPDIYLGDLSDYLNGPSGI